MGGSSLGEKKKKKWVPQRGPQKPLQTRTHTRSRLKSLTAGPSFFFHMQKPETDMPPPPAGVQFLLWCDCVTSACRLRTNGGRARSLMNFQCVEDDLLEHLKDL